MKLKKLLLSLVLVFSIGIFANNISANASSWHKGTPKFMIGTFQDFHQAKQAEPYQIASNNSRVAMWNSVNPFLLSTKTHYKYLGNGKYRLKGVPGSQGYCGGKSVFTVTKHGNNHFSLKDNYMFLKIPYNHKAASKSDLRANNGYYTRIHNKKLSQLGVF